MATKLLFNPSYLKPTTPKASSSPLFKHQPTIHTTLTFFRLHQTPTTALGQTVRRLPLPVVAAFSAMQPLDLTEENIDKVLADARVELAQLFDTSVGITGQVELAELDGPFVKIRLRGKFWHMRSTVVARLENYLKQRIPEILEVDIEDEKQLDDSPANF
ncbi:hypothetical protein BVRB_1g009130 [Beta vulgaris subsp. vulgaris]|uniref:uncharacterized protein LOC104892333 n=1 Tax=Beta vulgaris subsp. vulgaris TaxID=3555 RepID=UPI00054030D0|nr:uncharacterized protein LOC104892333 [Beta vulgaris subsp. vulgaris]KMT19864.1 hypothetical protein BVRB_1g009130 [Beta vulgaris subsp. vulgaris]